jgi:DNA-binding NarL/FixJ family response regulator
MAIEEQLRLQKRILAERVKELHCLFTIARIFNAPGLPLQRTLRKLCDAIKAAWQFPKKTEVRIIARREEARTSGFRESQWKLRFMLSLRGNGVGSIEVCYLGEPPAPEGKPFLPAEKKLLKAIAELTENMLIRKEVEREMNRTASRLQDQKRQLQRKNIALKEVLAQIEMEKRGIREQICSDISSTILPLLHALARHGMPAEQRQRYVEIIQRGLIGISSTASRAPYGDRNRLSPREAEIADLVRNGAASKEIARLLHVSETTVERHRHNIRRKVGIAGQKVNLVTYLSEGASQPLDRSLRSRKIPTITKTMGITNAVMGTSSDSHSRTSRPREASRRFRTPTSPATSTT